MTLVVKAILEADLSNRFRGGEQILSGLSEPHLEMEGRRRHAEEFFELSLEFARGHSLPRSQGGQVESFAAEALDVVDRFSELIHLAGSHRGLQEISRDAGQAQNAPVGRK